MNPLKIKQGQEQEKTSNDECADNVITFGSLQSTYPRKGRQLEKESTIS